MSTFGVDFFIYACGYCMGQVQGSEPRTSCGNGGRNVHVRSLPYNNQDEVWNQRPVYVSGMWARLPSGVAMKERPTCQMQIPGSDYPCGQPAKYRALGMAFCGDHYGPPNAQLGIKRPDVPA